MENQLSRGGRSFNFTCSRHSCTVGRKVWCRQSVIKPFHKKGRDTEPVYISLFVFVKINMSNLFSIDQATCPKYSTQGAQ